MQAFEFHYEGPSGLLTCRMCRALRPDDLDGFYKELDAALAAACALGTVRLLWDQRGLSIFPDDIAERVTEIGMRHLREGDRTAILVSSSLHKANGRSRMTKDCDLFLSENAALTWLRVRVAKAA